MHPGAVVVVVVECIEVAEVAVVVVVEGIGVAEAVVVKPILVVCPPLPPLVVAVTLVVV